MLGTDESPEQTRNILRAAAKRAMELPPSIAEVIEVHHAAARKMRRLIVMVPYADRLTEAMPCERPEARRAHTHALGMVRAVAMLHQFQFGRELRHGDVIHANLDHYMVARRLLLDPLGRALGGALPAGVANFGKRLKDRYGVAQFDATQAIVEDPILNSKGSEYLRALQSAGVVELVEPSRGGKPGVWRVINDPPEPGAKWLPTREELEDPQ